MSSLVNGFFDHNAVGTSNSLIGGWENSGGGLTYFLMSQIEDSLRPDQGLTFSQAWRVMFVVPFILIIANARGMWFLRDDADGAGIALVPHVHPCANGTFDGTMGAAGNLGDVMLAFLFGFHGSNYA